MASDGKVVEETQVSFPATGKWYRYDVIECTANLPQGEVELSIQADVSDDSSYSSYYFINLQKIQVYTGDVTPMPAPEENDSETNAALVAGTWGTAANVTPDDVNSLVVSPEGDSVTLFDGYNQAYLTFDCRVEAGLFIIYGPDFENCYSIREEGLINVTTEELEWVRVDNSNLTVQEANCDGLWYHRGDPDGAYYEISGSSCRKMVPADGDYIEQLSGPLVYDYSVLEDNGVPFPNHLTLEIGDTDLELTPTADGTMLIEEDFFEYQIYVREDLASSENVKACQALEALINDSRYHYAEDGSIEWIQFTPNCFIIRLSNDTQISGLWKLVDGTSLELSFEDGDVETIDLSDFDGRIFIGKVDMTFDPDI